MASRFRTRDTDSPHFRQQLQRKPRWPNLWKNSRSSSGSGDSLFTDEEVEHRPTTTSSQELPPVLPALKTEDSVPQIDQFYFGMDFEAPTFPTTDTASKMVANTFSSPSVARDSLNFVEPEMLASITSYTQLSFDQYPVVMDVSTLKYVDQDLGEDHDEHFDAYEEYKEDDWDFSDDDFCYTPIEIATAVPLARPECRPKVIRIGQAQSRASSPKAGHARSTSNSSASSVLSSPSSGAEGRSSFSSYSSDATSMEAFFETAQWLENEKNANAHVDSDNDHVLLTPTEEEDYTIPASRKKTRMGNSSIHAMVTQPNDYTSSGPAEEGIKSPPPTHRPYTHVSGLPHEDVEALERLLPPLPPSLPARSTRRKRSLHSLKTYTKHMKEGENMSHSFGDAQLPPVPALPSRPPPPIPHHNTSRLHASTSASSSTSVRQPAHPAAKSTHTYSLFPHVNVGAETSALQPAHSSFI